MKNRKNSLKFPQNAQNARLGPPKYLFNTLMLQNTQFYGYKLFYVLYFINYNIVG